MGIRGNLGIYLLAVALAASSLLAGCATPRSYTTPSGEFAYKYYSLVSEEVLLMNDPTEDPGTVHLIVGGDSGYSGTYCFDDPEFICLMLDGVYFAVPKDLDKRIGLITATNSIGWTFRGRDYELELDKGRRNFSILGHPFQAWWIRVATQAKGDTEAREQGRYLWSSACGLLAFTQVNEFKSRRDPATGFVYEEFWAEDGKGFGATPACGQ